MTRFNHWNAERFLIGIFLFGLVIVLACFAWTGTTANGMPVAQTISTPRVYLPSISNILPMPPPPNTPPLPTTSYYFYMPSYSQTVLDRAFNQGCTLGVRDMNTPGTQTSLVILDFGITQYQNGQYGASGMKVGGFYTMDQIGNVVFQFGKGYWTCTNTDYTSHLTIGIGTNNYNDGSVFSNISLTYAHGQAWATMVNKVYNRFLTECTRSCDGQVDVAGASDIELAWSAPQDAINWVNGYTSAAQYPLYNFGAAEGCPNFCGGGGYTWTKEQVWQVTTGGIIYPLPEIYLQNGANARQWYQLSLLHAQAHGLPFDFAGVMTQSGSCSPDCSVTGNTPQQGWTQLYSLIDGSVPLTWNSLPFATDIAWSE